MDKFSKFLVSKKKVHKQKKLEHIRREEEEQLRLEARKRGEAVFASSLLHDAMLTPRSPREIVISPRPLPENIMKEAGPPSKQKKKRASLNGEYIVGKELGKGSSGTVSMAINRTTGEIVAVKTVPKEVLSVEAEVRLRREYALMKVLHHPNLIKLTDVLENPQEIIIIMEYASHGDLFEYIVTQENQRLTEKLARPIFFQIALGVQYLHSQGFIHRDLKPENILMTDEGRVFIADLGFGTSWHPKKVSRTQCGSLMYASPEIVGNKEYVGPEVDVWSLGVLLYAMTTGRHPFHGNDENVRRTILEGSFKAQPYFSPELVDLLQNTLKVDRKQRFSVDQIVEHPWMASIADEWKAKTQEAIIASLSEGDGDSSGSEGEEKEKEKEKGKERKRKSGNRRFSFAWPSSHSDEPQSSPTSVSEPKRKRKNSKGL